MVESARPGSTLYDNEFVVKLSRREGSRPRSGQRDLYRHVFDEDNSEIRAWIDRALLSVGPNVGESLLRKLRSTAFDRAICELAVAEQLALTGCEVLYEPDLDGRTPDF